jgi:uncharacterized protein
MSKHPIVHVEISARNLASAAKFYSEIFGWKTEDIAAMNYVTFEAEGGPGGGFSPIGDYNPAGTVLVYIDSDDIEADLSKVVKQGGEALIHRTEIPGEGWFGVFVDPTGNKVGLFTELPKPM